MENCDDRTSERRGLTGKILVVGSLVYGITSLLTYGAAKLFNDNYFSESAGDIPFSVPGSKWNGWIRCNDGEKKVFIESLDGEYVSLERALSRVSPSLNRRNLGRESILEETSKYVCSE